MGRIVQIENEIEGIRNIIDDSRRRRGNTEIKRLL